jgi:hypothetical protein
MLLFRINDTVPPTISISQNNLFTDTHATKINWHLHNNICENQPKVYCHPLKSKHVLVIMNNHVYKGYGPISKNEKN